MNFTDHIMRDVLLAGIYDADIRREMYGTDKILQQPVNDVISLVEKKEMAREGQFGWNSKPFDMCRDCFCARCR